MIDEIIQKMLESLPEDALVKLVKLWKIYGTIWCDCSLWCCTIIVNPRNWCQILMPNVLMPEADVTTPVLSEAPQDAHNIDAVH